MITFSKFGHKGRLGNQLFQYAAMLGFAKKHGVIFTLPDWVYKKQFACNRIKPAPKIEYNAYEKAFHYTPEVYDRMDFTKNIDFEGYFQSEKYFEHCKEQVREELTPCSSDAHLFYDKYSYLFKKETIAVVVRRGDYVNNPNYELLPITYYFLALTENFPNWRDCNILIFSDDTAYCRVHFACLPNVTIVSNGFDNNNKNEYFTANQSAINQLYLGMRCNHFIISNTTYGWWMAWLGEKEGSKIVRPNYHFANKMKAENNTKDYYPERWTIFDHKTSEGKNKKIDLMDVTFTIPVSYDHPDRTENINLNIKMLQCFDTNILVGEQGSDVYSKGNYAYMKFQDKNFHRTRMLNVMAMESKTPIVANWDADVFISPIQIWYSIELIRKGLAEVVYPYDGRFARVPRTWYNAIDAYEDIGIVGATAFNGTMKNDIPSVGGAIFFNKESFIKGGGENEKFISYGPEDAERYHRFVTLGFKVLRTKGILYHIDHFRGPNSLTTDKNPFIRANRKEWKMIEKMNKEQLTKYVSTWTHLK